MRPIILIFLVFLLSSCEQSKSQSTQAPSAPAPVVAKAPEIVDRIVLKNGGVIEGKIVQESPDMVRIEWQGSVVGFTPGEIESIKKGASQSEASGLAVPHFQSEEEKKVQWPEGIDHRLQLKNGEWIDGRILKKENGAFVVRQSFKEGGAAEIEIPEAKVEKILLWRPQEIDHKARLAKFMEQYPNLQFIQKGQYNILTSVSDPLDLKFYLKKLDQFYSDFFIHFFGLFDLDRKLDPLDVIIFGTREEFAKVLTEVGYNAKSNPVGFYHFDAKKLVFYNIHSEQSVQSQLQQIKEYQSQLNKAEKINSDASILAQIHDAQDQVSHGELQLLGEVTSQNVKVIRHEGGHQLFHLTGVTPLEVYAGSWLIEGLAVYCETDPIGTPHVERLMQLKYELEKNELMPLEYLLNFRRGTEMHHLDPLYANLAYAQSWAFIYFLMQNYKEPFFNFLKEMRVQGPTYDNKAEIALLEKHLGKDLKTIELEFTPFVKKLVAENVDDKTYEDYRLRLISAT